MKLICLALSFLIVHSSLAAPNCSLPYRLGVGKSSGHFFSKNNTNNFFDHRFSAKKFVSSNQGKIKFYDFSKDVLKENHYSDIFDKNMRSLFSELLETKKINQTQYKFLIEKLAGHAERKPLVQKVLQTASLDSSSRLKLQKAINESTLNKSQLEILNEKLSSLDEKIFKHEDFFDYLEFSFYRPAKDFSLSINRLDDLIQKKSKPIRDFYKFREKSSRYESKIKNQLEKRFLKENKGNTLNTMQKNRLENEVLSKTRMYQKTLRSCGQTDRETIHSKQIEKKFTGFLVGFSTLTTVGGFTLANYQDPIDATWFKRLGYDVTISAFFSWIGAKVSINPNFSFLKKTAISGGASASLDIFDSALYDFLIGPEKELSEQDKKDIERLHQEFEKAKLDEVFIEKYQNYFYQNQEKKQTDLLFEEELDKEVVQEEMLETISSLIETGKIEDWLDFESEGLKRYTFHRGWDLISIPKTVLLGMTMYKVFCMSKLDPKSAYKKAATLLIADEIFESFIYYQARKTTINQ